jgi:putative CocE/NonD family hydrolase
VLVYRSEALTQDTEVTGPVTVKLWACSDALDTDFVARLVDIHPDGFAQNLTDGIIRARYRNGEVPELLQPDRPYEFTINLWSTANVFKAGHRIQLDIASANFPRWDRNPNTDAPFGSDAALQVAHQTILHDATHSSHVILPIIPR